jgi:hypothetical protein
MKDVLGKSIDQMFNNGEGHSGGDGGNHAPAPEGRIVGGSPDAQGHYDLPPVEDNVSTKSPPKAWVNHLD